MKLIYCPACQDVVRLLFEKRKCSCGKSWGLYVDDIDASIGGEAVPLGISNYSLQNALDDRKKRGLGTSFDSFVIPHTCTSILELRDSEEKLNTGEEKRVCIDDLLKKYPKPEWAAYQKIRETGLVEDVCEHGVGHPNRHWLKENDPDGKKMFGIHGCDGCCCNDENARN